MMDECGVCDGNRFHMMLIVAGDDTTDCAGDCAGDAVVDECGTCDGSDMTMMMVVVVMIPPTVLVTWGGRCQ